MSKRPLPTTITSSPPKKKKQKIKQTPNANLTAIGKNCMDSIHYQNGMKGKKFGTLGKEYGVKGKQFGHLTTKTARKQRESFSVFEKLHAIMYARKWGLAISIYWKWGKITDKEKRKQYKV